MSDRDDTAPGAPPPLVYQIRVKGVLGPEWADRFGGLSVAPCAEGTTVLTGLIADQAALFGLLRRLRDLGLPLLSVAPAPPGHTDAHAR